MNTPDPTKWTLNSRFAAFSCISVHLAMFRYYTELGAKWVELVQSMHKFVPWSRIRIFRNECTRSTPLDPKLIFWCVSYYLGAFGTIWLPYETCTKRAELVQKFVPRSCIRIFRNERTWSTQLDPKLMFWCVSYCLGAFATIRLLWETWGKTFRTTAKVRATKTRRNFSWWMHQIHPIGP